ncbi:hypothetical protein VKI21_12020 [Cyanobacterium aponinum UTEX 3222]|nr:hypothetical protein VKI21_12020 [Cyanobacterium aponinum UTEX 3222]
MMSNRLFLDTAFIQAILNRRDQYHQSALKILPLVKSVQEISTAEAILMEVGNALNITDALTTDHHFAQAGFNA